MSFVHYALPVLLLCGFPSLALARTPQDEKKPDLQFKAAQDATATPNAIATNATYTVQVRPNCGETDLFVYIENTAPRGNRPYYITASVNNKVIATATSSQKLAPNARELVHLKMTGEEPKPAETKGAEVKPTLSGRAITAKDSIELRAYYEASDVNDAKMQPVVLKLQQEVLTPDKYLDVKPSVVPNAGSDLGKLLFTISPKSNFKLQGAPCKLELDLSHVTGLPPETLKDAALLTELGPDMDQVVLCINDVRLADGALKLGGFFAITADGCRRAFRFTSAVGKDTTPQPVGDNNQVRVMIEKSAAGKPGSAKTIYIKPGKDQRIIARLEVDKADPGTVLEYGFDRSGTGTFETRRFPALKDQQLTVRQGKEDNEGTLRYAATLQDHEVPLNTVEGTTGKRTVQVRLIDGRTPRAAHQHEIIFDPNPPTITKFDKLTSEPKRGGKVKVSASATSLSNIEKVYFYVGEPPAVEAPATKLVPGTLNQTTGGYEAELPLPDQKGPLALGVRVVNGAGEKMDKALEIMVGDVPPAAAAAAKLGKIRAVVTEFDDLPQPNLPVDVRNAKGEFVKTGKTNEQGQVVFDKIPPGKYTVVSAKAADNTTGNATVNVEPEAEAVANINLKRGR